MKTITKNTSLFELREISKNINREEIVANLENLLLLRVPAEREVADRLSEQKIRDLVSVILNRLSPERLVDCFKILIKSLHSGYELVRIESKRLLEKIDPLLLSDRFDGLLELKNDANFGVKRFAEALVLKIATTWTIEEKKRHYDLILKWQKSHIEEEIKVGNLLALQIMESWQIEGLCLYMPFLVECSDLNKNDFETADLAATLAFKYLSVAPLIERLRHLKYMVSFSECGHKELRRGFRTMALKTLDLVEPKVYYKYAIFLLKCLDGRSKTDYDSAWEKLLKINPDKLPVCELVYCQISGLHRVRHAGKELVKKVSDDVLLENLEELLKMQGSDCIEVRYQAMKLAVKISHNKLATKKDLLKTYVDSRMVDISDLANCLLLSI